MRLWELKLCLPDATLIRNESLIALRLNTALKLLHHCAVVGRVVAGDPSNLERGDQVRTSTMEIDRRTLCAMLIRRRTLNNA